MEALPIEVWVYDVQGVPRLRSLVAETVSLLSSWKLLRIRKLTICIGSRLIQFQKWGFKRSNRFSSNKVGSPAVYVTVFEEG